jgi:hypothetical protein
MSEPVRLVSRAWHLDGTADPPNASVLGTPPRRAGSLRRTSSLSASWPDGREGPEHLTGRARDLVTSMDGDPGVRAEEELALVVDRRQTITAATTRPGRDGVRRLIGANAVRGFRTTVESALPNERHGVTPLALLLDDVSTVSMIGGIAWSQHPDDSDEGDDRSLEASNSFLRSQGSNVACSGFRRSGYYRESLEKRIMYPHWFRPAGDLEVDDEWAWHAIEPAAEVCFRRRRRIDTWPAGDSTVVDAHYRDSIWGPTHDEVALHEYSLNATIDTASHALSALAVTANVLPFPECPSVVQQVQDLVGLDVTGLRAGVQRELPGILGCTHLNDMLRGLSDVPALVSIVGQ